MTPPDVDPALQGLVDQAVADLATHLSVDASADFHHLGKVGDLAGRKPRLPAAGDDVHPGDRRRCVDRTEALPGRPTATTPVARGRRSCVKNLTIRDI